MVRQVVPDERAAGTEHVTAPAAEMPRASDGAGRSRRRAQPESRTGMIK